MLATNAAAIPNINLIEQMVSLPAFVQSIIINNTAPTKIRAINAMIEPVDAMITITSNMVNQSINLHGR